MVDDNSILENSVDMKFKYFSLQRNNFLFKKQHKYVDFWFLIISKQQEQTLFRRVSADQLISAMSKIYKKNTLDILTDERLSSTDPLDLRLVDYTYEEYQRNMVTSIISLNVPKAFDRHQHEGVKRKKNPLGYSLPMVQLVESNLGGISFPHIIWKNLF